MSSPNPDFARFVARYMNCYIGCYNPSQPHRGNPRQR